MELNRRRFLQLFGTAASAAIIAPKVYVFAPTNGWVKGESGLYEKVDDIIDATPQHKTLRYMVDHDLVNGVWQDANVLQAISDHKTFIPLGGLPPRKITTMTTPNGKPGWYYKRGEIRRIDVRHLEQIK